jgi:ABC-type branched-subunit amino acid transport system permease subunit
MWSRANLLGALAFAAVAAAAPWLPAWIVSLATIAFANALVVLGLVILWRAGLVPFGQALFYAIGAYAVALLGRYTPLRDVFLLIGAGAVAAGLTAFLVGFLLARYRDIFFAMLSLALSMVLWGVLVKTETLGSTDGFHVEAPTFFGFRPRGPMLYLAIFWLVLGFSAIAAYLVGLYFRSVAGALAVPIRDNEIRVEFLGISANRLIHLKLVISGILAGIGGALAAIAVAHVDPNMAYWTTSGGFVFVTILAGTASVAAAFIGSFVFELVRSVAIDLLPGTWQMILGSVLLLTILFLPEGIGSLFSRRRRDARHDASPEAAIDAAQLQGSAPNGAGAKTP